MLISIIAALSEDRVIGKNNKIPWHIKGDLVRFRDITTGHAVIMGRKTFESLMDYYKKSGRPLPKWRLIIISRNKNYQVNLPDCYVVNSIGAAIKLGKKLEKKELFIAGGAEIFAQTINLADKLYLTIVKGKFAGDSFFPEYKKVFKKVISDEEKEENGYRYKFLELIK